MIESELLTRENLLREAAELSIQYLAGLDERSVGVKPDAVERLMALDEPLPESGAEAAATLALLDEIGSPATTATAGGRFFGYVIGGTLPVALAANWLAAAWDQDAGMASICPINATLEEVARGWLVDLLGLPAESGAAFVTGATMANFAGLAAARHAVLARRAGTSRRDGLFGAPPITVVVGDEVHVSLLKALALLGLGRARVMRVPADRQGRMRADALPPLAGPTIVCLQAGNVNTGAFDPAREICCPRRARPARGSTSTARSASGRAAAPERAHLVDGRRARRFVGDATRTNGSTCPMTAGSPSCVTRRRCTPRWGDGRVPRDDRDARAGSYTPEMSRRARGRRGLGGARSLGREGVADLVERSCRHAARFAEGLRGSRASRSLNDVVLNQVLVAFGYAERTRRVIAAVAGRRHLLVRRDGLAGPDRHAHQRLLLGDDHGGRGAKSGGDGANRQGDLVPGGWAAISEAKIPHARPERAIAACAGWAQPIPDRRRDQNGSSGQRCSSL